MKSSRSPEPLSRPRAGHPRRTSSMRIAGLLATLALCFFLDCSCQRSSKPVTITFLDLEWDVRDRLPGLAQDLRDFTQETGIRINRLPGPDGSLNQLALWRELLRKGAGAPDVCNIDAIWSGILNEYLMDLKAYISSDLFSQDPVVVGSYTVGHKLVAIPHHAYVGGLFYRPDLLQQYGYRRPPKSWDELETMAARIQAGERAKGKNDFWGFTWEGAEGEDLTCMGLEWQFAEGGGRIVEEDGTISVNNPQTIRAWQRAVHWIGSISPPGVAVYGKWDAENLWGAGKTAFHRGWMSDYSLVALQTPPAGASAFGVTSMPAGAAARVGTLGGNALAVPRSSAHPQEALAMIRFLRRKDIQRRHAREHSEPPIQFELFALPSILQPYPGLPQENRDGGGVVARPSIVAGGKYEAVSRAYIRALHSVLTGKKTAPIAAAALEKELIAITGFKNGPPSTRRW